MRQITPYLLVGIGGFLGATARLLVGTWVGSTFGTRFPLGTFVVNISGCFAIGILGTLIADRLIDRPDHVHALLVVGFLGAYTTFSAFGWENHGLWVDERWLTALVYIVASVAVGLLAVRLGVLTARALF